MTMLSKRALLFAVLLFSVVDGYSQCPFGKLQKVLSPQTAAAAIQTATTSLRTNQVQTLALVAGPASALEMTIVNRLESAYQQTSNIKCPFFRRRASDMLEGVDMIARFVVIRHKSLDLPLGCRVQTSAMAKNKNMAIHEIFRIIMDDWKLSTDKGYYISGRLNTTIYREDCKFDGPDPDMPVRGLRKFLNAASQLFDYGSSYAELMSLRVENPKLLVAHWRMEGVLRLPWRPVLPQWTGTTYYHLDDDNQIYLHDETWDMSVAEAFMRTISPQIGERIWNQ
eukprot:CAMPEP_0119013198 /NCGR_PEP_ID=MMETSP1176-20130426/8123_1 /TAXON_ID=265551 /ORGANISM="Synedropsis recta cf, Strain CCMP1620" /LENGTH=281 /DNA_ID=CAMNT_0006966261 /DNA_START=84 /DNA_END=929 /DNA_ORIENTATION=+